MPKINILPKHIADLIAAGEVVDRPASIIKETVENAIDAGASIITVEIKRGGISYTRVSDNGCGIAREDIRNAFLSHATSKVTNIDDLNSIMTLGFRGEALASICAVSRVDVLTKTPHDEIGTRYSIEYGEEKCIDYAGCPAGTTIVIRDLFSNTPARMKFLKKDVTEGNAVAAVIDGIALSHPEISFRFVREDREVLLTHGDGKLISAAYACFGKEFASSLLEVKPYELNGIKVSGYVSKPYNSRANRSMQYFYVNSRLVKTKTGFAALEEAYKNIIMTGKFPACILKIDLPFEAVDVNVHPSKLEVRFSNEKAVFNAVYYAVLNTVKADDTMPEIDLSKIASRPNFTFNSSSAAPKQYSLGSNSRPSSIKQSSDDGISENIPAFGNVSIGKTVVAQPVISYFDNLDKQDIMPSEQNEAKAPDDVRAVEEAEELPEEEFNIIGEAFSTYILVEKKDEILIVDKHAAHERMIYNRLKKSSGGNEAQVLLSPITVTLNKDEYSALTDNLDIMKSAGYDIEDFGVGNVLVNSCPIMLSAEEVKDAVLEIASYLSKNKNMLLPERIDWIYHSAACRSAIKAGDNTTREEMIIFIKELLMDKEVRYCPHGRPVIIELKKRELEKRFGRIN